MKRIAAILLLASVALANPCSVLLAGEAGDGTGAGPFKLSLALEGKKARAGEAFRVKVDVRNVSREEATFEVLSVTFAEHFFTTSTFLRVVVPPADKNFPKAHTLAPGKSWTPSLDIEVLAGAPPKLDFRLAFNPIGFPRAVFLSAPFEIEVAGGQGEVDQAPLEVTAVPSVKEAAAGEKIELVLDIRNVSRGDVTFTIHGTSWAREWMSSDTRLTFAVPNVRREIRKEVTLETGQSIRKTLTVWVKEGTDPGDLAFRMVFRPVYSSTVYVSTPVKLTVKK